MTPRLVYHHRYRITVRLRRYKGYIPVKGNVEGSPVAYDGVSYLTRARSVRIKQEREGRLT